MKGENSTGATTRRLTQPKLQNNCRSTSTPRRGEHFACVALVLPSHRQKSSIRFSWRLVSHYHRAPRLLKAAAKSLIAWLIFAAQGAASYSESRLFPFKSPLSARSPAVHGGPGRCNVQRTLDLGLGECHFPASKQAFESPQRLIALRHRDCHMWRVHGQCA
jgi:hypothetical protein